MVSRLILDNELQRALREIGPVEPWWSEEDALFIFEHARYPMVAHGDADIEQAKAGYLRALRGFIRDRLTGQLADDVERITSGRGGARRGSGRPKGSRKPSTSRVTLPSDVAVWLKQDQQHIERVRAIMNEAS